MKKGDLVTGLEIIDISSDGRSVGKHDGLVIFVKAGVPGDIADVRISHKRRKYVEGRIENLRTPSPWREEPFCEHFGTCGGCKWQHFSYQGQLTYKQNHVDQNLSRITGAELPDIQPILGSEKTRFYRNKLEFTFSNKRWLTKEEIHSGEDLERRGLGFHVPGRFDKVLDINTCYLQGDPSNAIRDGIKDYALQNDLSFFDLRDQHGLLRNLIIRTSSTGETMVIVQFFEPDQAEIDRLMQHVQDTFPDITSLNYIINTKKNESYHDQEVICFAGQPFIEEQMADLTFRIGPKSFYQTNSSQAEVLYNVVTIMAGFKGDELVYDLYTGTGTIANYIAHQVKKVIGIEYVPEAIEDAHINAEINGIENTDFFAGDMKDILNDTFISAQGQPDVIIADPPRAGMHPDVVETIRRIAPAKIIYVSCNPATQARDLQLLLDQYVVREIQPVDMFPHTQHVENVVLIDRIS